MIASPEVLVDLARRQTGLHDLGPDGWQEGLAQLVAAVRTDIGDEADVVEPLERMFVGRLEARLRVEQRCTEARVDDLALVPGPLFITGLPRTGTTALHYLLAVDPSYRHLRAGEVEQPVRREPPSKDVQHIATPDGPVEDGPLHALHFRNGELVLPLPSYTDWWRTADHASSFVFHERVLRLLQAGTPERWLLKSPQYVFQLPELAARYPDARFIVTHRDLGSVVPSTCSVVLSSRGRRLPNRNHDPQALGQEMVGHWSEGVRRMIRARRQLGEDRFLDVGQAELETDPVGVAERVYAFAGLPMSEVLRADMDRWAIDNRRGSRGEHRYDSAEFGLTSGEIERAFGEYLERFGALC